MKKLSVPKIPKLPKGKLPKSKSESKPKKAKMPKGYHMMPDGKMMKNSAHKRM